MEFICAELLNLSNKYNLWGNTTHNSSTQVFTIKGKIKDNSESIRPIWTGMDSMISTTTGEFMSVVVNSVNIGSGRLTNLSFDSSTDIRNKIYTATFEFITPPGTGVLDTSGGWTQSGNNFQGYTNLYSIFNSNTGIFIRNFSENTDFTQIGSGKFSYSKNISFGIDAAISSIGTSITDAAKSIILESKKLYSNSAILLASYPDFYKNYSGLFNTRQDYNTINNTFSYSEDFIFDTGNNYSWIYNTDVNFDGTIFTLSENGNIRSSQLLTNKIEAAEIAWTGIQTGIYGRLSGIFNDYTGILLYTGICGLKNQPQNSSIKKDMCDGSIDYSQTYSNNHFINTGFYLSYSNNISVNGEGYLQITENGSLKAVNIKPSGFATVLSGFNNNTGIIINRIYDIYNDSYRVFKSCSYTTGLYKLSESRTYREYDAEIDYSYTYTENPTYIDNGLFQYSKVTIKDSKPIHMVNYFPIPHSTIIAQRANQSTRGTLTNTIELRGEDLSLQDYITGVTNYIIPPTGSDVYMKDFSYSFNPLDNKFTADIVYGYTDYRNGNRFLV